jgi:carbon storage regulator
MLVLTRKPGERIIIDRDIVVEVLSVQGNRVRLGIQAPPGQGIFRQELLDRETQAGEANPSGRGQAAAP